MVIGKKNSEKKEDEILKKRQHNEMTKNMRNYLKID